MSEKHKEKLDTIKVKADSKDDPFAFVYVNNQKLSNFLVANILDGSPSEDRYAEAVEIGLMCGKGRVKNPEKLLIEASENAAKQGKELYILPPGYFIQSNDNGLTASVQLSPKMLDEVERLDSLSSDITIPQQTESMIAVFWNPMVIQSSAGLDEANIPLISNADYKAASSAPPFLDLWHELTHVSTYTSYALDEERREDHLGIYNERETMEMEANYLLSGGSSFRFNETTAEKILSGNYTEKDLNEYYNYNVTNGEKFYNPYNGNPDTQAKKDSLCLLYDNVEQEPKELLEESCFELSTLYDNFSQPLDEYRQSMKDRTIVPPDISESLLGMMICPDIGAEDQVQIDTTSQDNTLPVALGSVALIGVAAAYVAKTLSSKNQEQTKNSKKEQDLEAGNDSAVKQSSMSFKDLVHRDSGTTKGRGFV